MMRDELLRYLGTLPPDTDVLVDVGRVEIDIVDILGVNHPTERNTVTLSLHPGDLDDAFAAYRASLSRGKAPQEPPLLV